MVLMLRVVERPEVTELDPKVAVTPAGAPLTLRATVWDVPEVVAVDTVELAELPWPTDADVGLKVMEKSFFGAAVTVSVMVALWLPEVAVPVTVRVEVPAAVDAPTAIVSVELVPEFTEVGDRVAVVPAGAPVTVSATAWATPEVVLVAIVMVPDLPVVIDVDVADGVMEKSLATGAVTVKV